MSRPIPSPEEQHDWRKDRHGLDRAPSRDLWVAGLVGAIAGGLSMLLMMAFLDGLPNAGKLNGCEAMTAAECTIFAQEER